MKVSSAAPAARNPTKRRQSSKVMAAAALRSLKQRPGRAGLLAVARMINAVGARQITQKSRHVEQTPGACEVAGPDALEWAA